MALERIFDLLRGGRKDGKPATPASIQVFSNLLTGKGEHPNGMTKEQLAQYPGLEQYREALAYLSKIGVSLEEIQAICPTFEDFAESEFDDHGHAFMYVEGPYKDYRLDRVLFPSDTYYPYILAADRQTRYAPHRGHSLGVYTMPKRRIRMNVYPDESVSLQLQAANDADLTDMATFFIDHAGTVSYSEMAMKNSHHLNPERTFYEERTMPRPIETIADPDEAQAIAVFSNQLLQEGWGLTETDIAIPSAELARSILTAPTELGIDLKAMIDY